MAGNTGSESSNKARIRGISPSHITQLASMLAEIRLSGIGLSRSTLCEKLGLGRNAVDQRLQTAFELGLVGSGGHGASTGGRVPEVWCFNFQAGTMLIACVSYRDSVVALTYLDGTVIERKTIPVGIIDTPNQVCHCIAQHFETLLQCVPHDAPTWAISLTVPSPVDFRTGVLVDPIARSKRLPDVWAQFPVRAFFSRKFGLPTWIEDEVNAMALTAAVVPNAPLDLLYVRLSLGIGLGIVSGGKVHRGALGISGELGHIQVDSHSSIVCRCGRRGCLETVVSGFAFEELANQPNSIAHSAFLRDVLTLHEKVRCEDVFEGIKRHDSVCRRIATNAGKRLANVLAVLATTYNPGEIVIGGSASDSGNFFAIIVSQLIRERVLPTTSARLSIRMGSPDNMDEIRGAATLATDGLLSTSYLSKWITYGSPVGCAMIANRTRQDY